MFNKYFIFFTILISAPTFASVSFSEKQMKVDSLIKLQSLSPALAFEAYQRELEYEQNGLSIDERAKNEANLLINKIRNQVNSAYKESLQLHKSPEIAREEIKANIEMDLQKADPQMKNELINMANSSFDAIESAEMNENLNYTHILSSMKSAVKKRLEFLNRNEILPKKLKNKDKEILINDSQRKIFNTKSELLESLLSDRESSRWVSSSNQTIKTVQLTKSVATISLQLKLEFLGIDIEAGPRINFKREFRTDATIMAEGLSPLVTNVGNFDYWKRNKAGKIINKDGVDKKRDISFYCSSELQFESEYNGAGGFKFMGVGGEISTTQIYSNSASLSSRRIALPESVDGKSMTMNYISNLCHNDFLGAKFNKTMTIEASLNILMKNIVSGIVFSHPKTRCSQDEQCYDWFNNKIIAIAKNNNFPRCVETNNIEKFRSCQLQGLEGQNCPVYEKGKHISEGLFEFACDTGLKCVKYQNPSFVLGSVWTYAKGKCQISNKNTYKDPFEIANEKKEYRIEFVPN